jgi:hypothetical protein
VQQLVRHDYFFDLLDIRPRSNTAGLIQTYDGRVLYQGSVLVPPPLPPYPTRRIPNALIAELLQHYTLFAQDPWAAMSRYTCALSRLQSNPDTAIAADAAAELLYWRTAYRDTVGRYVFRHIDEHALHSAAQHVRWNGAYPPQYTSRPRVSVLGRNHVPVYRVLWAWARQDEVLPAGRPRKIDTCGDTFSDDPDMNFRMCVNPWHFKTHYAADDPVMRPYFEARRFVQNSTVRFQWNLKDIGHVSYLANGTVIGKCPNGHDVPHDITIRSLDSTTPGRFVCYLCKEAAKLERWRRGRATPRTRNRWPATVEELDQVRETTLLMLHPDRKPVHVNTDEEDTAEFIRLAQMQSAKPEQ